MARCFMWRRHQSFLCDVLLFKLVLYHASILASISCKNYMRHLRKDHLTERIDREEEKAGVEPTI